MSKKTTYLLIGAAVVVGGYLYWKSTQKKTFAGFVPKPLIASEPKFAKAEGDKFFDVQADEQFS